ncbi:DUF3105 domain-containing protein [Bailinhaonella thermotolerans]|uniref:DUF3105 domain-containing protein n=1 Tax=Bailinhaonella thermotolerans TaxID=1070861 RepID=A0A3A4BE05_9ACTN|nr:DUF3105 domain-containing protein [Bailinhaonella thermotolerans]RJL32530.1 DUF3105 domain-containing protein [Bailinhaonella thermotolerans]
MSKNKAQARREHIERMRADAKRKERRTALLTWGAGAFVVVLLIGLVAGYIIYDRKASALTGVQTFKYSGGEHVQPGQNVQYKETPPAGGPHDQEWQNCGIYDKPIRNEHAVHSLEHGAVWITYKPDLPKDQVETLRETVGNDGYLLLSPYEGLPAPVVASSWGRQIKLDGADDPRLKEFIKKYKQAPDTPELGASCSGTTQGTPIQP